MSVLACDRVGCEKIMCSYLILGNRYYICYGCLQELEELGESLTGELSEAEAEELIRQFMYTPKNEVTRGPAKEIFNRVLDLHDQDEE